MKVYFLRHGLAGHASQWQGDDWERPLTEEGQARMAQEAAGLARLGILPEVVVSSPLLRALQTAKIAATGLPGAPEVMIDRRLAPGFDARQLGKILADHAERGSLMLVGHEPDFSQTIGQAIGGGEVVCKKGGLAWIDVPDPPKAGGRLVALLTPGMLGASASGLTAPDDQD